MDTFDERKKGFENTNWFESNWMFESEYFYLLLTGVDSGKDPGSHSFPLSKIHTFCPARAHRLAAIDAP